jgi:integrase
LADLLNRLTALQVNKLTIKGYHADGGGLYLSVSKTGTKSWIFRYDYESKRYELGLGSLHTITLQEARLQAKKYRAEIVGGVNPKVSRIAAKQAQRLASANYVTFDDCAKDYIVDVVSVGKKSEKNLQQWKNTLRDYASPVIGKLSVSDITPGLVCKVLEPIWSTKTETARRLLQRIARILDYAKAKEWRTGDNPAQWKGKLDAMLPDPKDFQIVEHQPALHWSEIGEFIFALRQEKGQAARGLELQILTAVRPGNIQSATWSDFDLENGVWIIPAEKMKGSLKKARKHQVPLCTQAIKLIDDLPRIGDFLFPGERNDTFSENTLNEVLKRMNDRTEPAQWVDRNSGRKVVAHGFRSSFRDWVGEATTFSELLAESALAHAIKDKTEAAYKRGDQLDRRRELMQAWATYCDQPKAGATVLQLPRDRRVVGSNLAERT